MAKKTKKSAKKKSTKKASSKKRVKAAATRRPAKKTKAKKAKKAKRPARKKAPAKKATAKRAPAKKASKRKSPAQKKAPVRKKPQTVGEGDYQASRTFLKDQSGFVKANKARIPELGKDAERALEGPEGDALRQAEATAAARSRDTFE